ncbi:MAG: glycoside hydrolase family 95 protein [Bacteroidota bacterium]|nr:glycoside hydrolase family 95 protein [Bacteroidota bacterium]
MNTQKKVFISLIICLVTVTPLLKAEKSPLSLWYDQPAGDWMKSLPIGNGRLGAMVFGGIQKETIALNEVTMWSGQVDDQQEQVCGKEKLDEIRQQFFNGNLAEGNRLATKYMSGTPHSFGSHLPIGDLCLEFNYPEGKIRNYKRDLNLENAVASVSFEKGNLRFSREYFCSNPAGIMVVKLSVNKKAALNCSVSLDLLRQSKLQIANNSIEFSGQASFPRQGPGGVAFLGKIAAKSTDGAITVEGNKLVIKNATTVYLFVDVRTNYKSAGYEALCRKTVDKSLKTDFQVLKQKHILDYQRLFNRVSLSFGKSDMEDLPTDLRWVLVKEGKNDVGLDALFFQYARYLLIAASREDSPLPANLQGIWNDNLANNMGWTCDYHLDINTEQNYWLSNVGNLSECNKPLFDYIKDLSVYGQKTAQNVYGARGWTAHTVANIWGYTSPGSGVNWGLFPLASTWIASHLWKDYCYTQDKMFLKNEAYPILKSNAYFVLDLLKQLPGTDYLVAGPSTSPENSFRYKGDELSLSMMPTVELVLAKEIFSSVIQASEILNVDDYFRDSLKIALAKLPPLKIGKNGAVQEWLDDYQEANPNHRHTSHLLALYPFNQISVDKTPDLAKAASNTIKYRVAAQGWEDVEWSRANIICNYARLKDPVTAYQSVVNLQRNFTRENLLTISPKGIAGAPYDIFIFDGNEAGAAGIAEMLIQSQNGYIEFLPALPVEWKTGYFNGLCVQGGAVVDLKWKDGKVQNAFVKATTDNTFKIKLANRGEQPKYYKNGILFSVNPDTDGLIQVTLHKDETLNLKYE